MRSLLQEDGTLLLLHEELDAFHASRCTLLSTWQILEGRNGHLLAHIHDAEMWEIGSLLSLPIGTLLEVEHLVERRIALLAVRLLLHSNAK